MTVCVLRTPTKVKLGIVVLSSLIFCAGIGVELVLRFYGFPLFGFLIAKKNSFKGVDVLFMLFGLGVFGYIESGCSMAESASTVTVQIASERSVLMCANVVTFGKHTWRSC